MQWQAADVDHKLAGISTAWPGLFAFVCTVAPFKGKKKKNINTVEYCLSTVLVKAALTFGQQRKD